MQYLHGFARLWWLIVLATVAGAALLLTLDSLSPETYVSSSTVLVSATPAGAPTSAEAYTTNLLAQGRMATYSDIARSPELAEDVIDDLDLALSPREVQDRVVVTVSGLSTALSIVVRDTEPERAQQIAASAADSIVRIINAAEAGRGQAPSLLRARWSGEPGEATAAVPPPSWRNPMIGAAGGLAIGLALAVAVARLDRRVRDESTVAEVLAAPVLGVLPTQGSRSRRSGRARNGYREALRELRTCLFFLRTSPDRCHTIAISSPQPVDSVTQIASDLATALADTGSRVLLVDADLHDLRQPPLLDQHVEESAGLTAYLTGASVEGRVIWHDDTSGVDVVPAGSAAPHAADLLHSDAFATLLDDVSKRYDFVLVIAPDTSRGTDALAVAAICDGSLLLVERRTRKAHLLEASRDLRRVHSDVLGAVLLS